MREKKLTNVRNTGSEEKVSLSPLRVFTLEDAIGTLSTFALSPCWYKDIAPGAFALKSALNLILGCNLSDI